jgi:hypothetical protein
MNQFRCKQFKPTVVLGITMLVVGFSTVTVEKAVLFQAETTVQLWTSTDQRPKTHRLRVGSGPALEEHCRARSAGRLETV